MKSFAAIKPFIYKILPWLITVAGLYYAFRGVRWDVLLKHIGEAQPLWLSAAVVLTVVSYLLRSRRWQGLFPERVFNFLNAARVLFLGFFMNNILPARAGELVRAHMGARLASQTRTLVLATIAAERLLDGLTISFMFVAFAVGLGDPSISKELLLVAYFFGLAGILVLLVIALRQRLYALINKVNLRINSRASNYTYERLQIFINGLTPLSTRRKAPRIVVWSLIIWGVELLVYKAVTLAFSADLSLPQCVLFMVAVNFASLIPAAPAGLGVIEAVASAVLVSIGVEKELALTMVIAQHAMQYLVVGVPGAIIMFNWKKTLRQLKHEEQPLNRQPEL